MAILENIKVDQSDKTMIKGSIVKSTIEQLYLLGTVGEEILRAVDLPKIDVTKTYHRSIRGRIHETILKRFGKDALFYLGFEQFDQSDFLDLIWKEWHGKRVTEIKKEYRQKATTRQIEIERDFRNWFLTVLVEFHYRLGKTLILPEEGKLEGGCDFYEKDVIIYRLKNAVYRGHHDFNTGSVLKLLLMFVGDSWHINVAAMEDKFIFEAGLTDNYFKIDFSFKNKHEPIKKVVQKIRSHAKDNFLKGVINASERERKLAFEQSKKLEIVSKKIAKYIPPQINDALFKGDYDTEITTRRRKLTIFFSDIKNFTSTSEGLQPEDLTKYLNEYFSEMTQIALDQGATIDKYIGDAVMLFFGDPQTKGERNDARACVEMALQMQERMIVLREKWLNEGFSDPFQIRIGLNTGYCNVGNFGSDQRLTYTIIGGEVNVAARLESAADADGILMSYETYAHAQDMVDVEERQAIKMKGINREIKILSVVGRKTKIPSKLEAHSSREMENKNDQINEISTAELLKRIENLELKVKNLTKG